VLLLQIGSQGTIKKVEGGCLAGRPTWMSADQSPPIQPIRANNIFYGRPWFDSVQVLRVDEHVQEVQAYAELRLLFEANVSTSVGPQAQHSILISTESCH